MNNSFTTPTSEPAAKRAREDDSFRLPDVTHLHQTPHSLALAAAPPTIPDPQLSSSSSQQSIPLAGPLQNRVDIWMKTRATEYVRTIQTCHRLSNMCNSLETHIIEGTFPQDLKFSFKPCQYPHIIDKDMGDALRITETGFILQAKTLILQSRVEAYKTALSRSEQIQLRTIHEDCIFHDLTSTFTFLAELPQAQIRKMVQDTIKILALREQDLLAQESRKQTTQSVQPSSSTATAAPAEHPTAQSAAPTTTTSEMDEIKALLRSTLELQRTFLEASLKNGYGRGRDSTPRRTSAHDPNPNQRLNSRSKSPNTFSRQNSRPTNPNYKGRHPYSTREGNSDANQDFANGRAPRQPARQAPNNNYNNQRHQSQL